METREQWMQRAVELMRPHVRERAGLDVPTVAVSVGFPYGRGGRHAIGQCHYQTADGAPALFIHPSLDDGARVLDVLMHEALHAALPAGTGHRKAFAHAALACGLAGKPTATVAGEALKPTLAGWMDTLGPYPHARVDTSQVKKQTTRMLRVSCPDDGYTVRTTRTWLDAMGTPSCPCGTVMEEG
jgi:hypothetical protein